MTTLTIDKFIREPGEEIYGWLTVVTVLLCVAQIPAKPWANTASSAFTGANNTWFNVWAADTMGELNWEVFHHKLEGQYQVHNPVTNRASLSIFFYQTFTVH